MRAIVTLLLLLSMATGASAFDKWSDADCQRWAITVVREIGRAGKPDPRLVEITTPRLLSRPSDDWMTCIGAAKFANGTDKLIVYDWMWSDAKGAFDLTIDLGQP